MSALVRFPRVDHLTVIGGGDMMLQAARDARSRGMTVTAVFSPRHAEEPLPLAGGTSLEVFTQDGFSCVVVDDINVWPGLHHVPWAGPRALALCFGPAWIFTEPVRAAFGLGMYNINAIPVPHYLGGAHYTWQILNGDRRGGCVLQEITADLDRGRLLRRHSFELPATARTPQDYYDAYLVECRGFLGGILDDLRNGASFHAMPYEAVAADRYYLPRLYTIENAWIDWSWSADEILRFCCGFDRPYKGAATEIDGVEVRLRGVTALPDDGLARHPFLAGLVVRRHGDGMVVAARDGLLEIGEARTADGDDARSLLREGRRLATTPERLHRALTWRLRLTGTGIRKD